MEKLIEQTKPFFLSLQQAICHMAESEDSYGKFTTDTWQRDMGGEGKTRVLQNGHVFEQAGVNFSHVYGDKLPKSATASRLDLANCRFHAMGVSVVMHPKNPYVPTSHFNVRIFIAEKQDKSIVWWFGGGFDLTPYYGFREDCVHWHSHAKLACEPFGSHFYPQFKHWCDEYFYLPHRNEARGIGGIFFDDFNELSFEKSFAFIQNVGKHYITAYKPIVSKRKSLIYGEQERNFQLLRRGRYVEFNLLYDRGTIFGLQSKGRTSSILMSLPPVVNWQYEWHPPIGSKEEKLYTDFLPPRDWAKSTAMLS